MRTLSHQRVARCRPVAMVMLIALCGASHLAHARDVPQGATPRALDGQHVAPVSALQMPAEADLAVRIDTLPRGSAVPHDAVEVHVAVTNRGPREVADATTRIALPIGLRYEGLDLPPHISCATPSVGQSGTLVCRGSAALDVRDVIIVRTRVTSGLVPGTWVTTVATVASALRDPTPDDNVADVRMRTSLPDHADLWVASDPWSTPGATETVTPARLVGSTFTHPFVVGNNGRADAVNTRLAFTLPSNLRFERAEMALGDCGGSVCTLGDVPPGYEEVVEVTVTVVAPGPLGIEATETSNTPENVPATNRAIGPSEIAALPTEAALGVTLRGPATLAIGGESTLVATVTDAGPSAPVSPLLRLLLPAGLTVVSVDGGCTTIAPCPLMFPPGSRRQTIRVVVRVADDYAGPAAIDVSAEVTSGNDSYVTDNVGTFRTTIAPASTADVAVTMVDSPEPVLVGTPVTYLVSVVNRGPELASGVVLSDLPPIELVTSGVETSAGTCDVGATVRCDLGDLAVGAPVLIRLTADAPPQAETTATNRVAVETSSADPEAANDTAVETTAIVDPTAADVRMTLVSSRPVLSERIEPGDTVVMTYLVENLGPDDAERVAFYTDSERILPSVSLSGCVAGRASMSCEMGTLAAGTSATVEVTWRVPDEEPFRRAFYVTVYAVAYAQTLDLEEANSQIQSSIPIWHGPADLRATIDGPVTAAFDETISYTIRLGNVGPGWGRETILNVVVPTGMTLDSATSPCEAGFPCRIGDFAAGGESAITATYRVTRAYPSPTLTARASVTSETEDAQPADNSAEHTATLTGHADIRLTARADNASPDLGSPVQLTIEAHNDGPSDATGIIVTNRLPPGLRLVTGEPSVGEFDASSGEWSVAALGAGASAQLVLHAEVVRSGELVITATTTELGQPDLVPGNNTAGVAMNAAATADLAIHMTADREEAAIGDEVTFLVGVYNSGPDPATEVVVSNRLPDGLALLDATPSHGVYDEASGDWTIGTIAPGASATLTVRARRDAGGPLTNRALVVRQREVDPAAANNAAGVTVGGPSADIGVVMTVSESSAAIGQTITFTVAATNHGPHAASGVTVTDLLPAGLVFVEALPTQGSYRADTGRWDIGALAASGSEARATLSVTATVAASGSFTNTARLKAVDLPDPNDGNDASSLTVESGSVDLAASLTLTGDLAAIGSAIALNVTATNVGAAPHDAPVRLEMILPSSLQFVAAEGLTCTTDGFQVRCESAAPVRLAPGERTTWPFTMTVLAGPEDGAAAVMTVSSARDLQPANDMASVAIGAAGPSADLRVSEIATVTTTDAAFHIVYDLKLENAGPSDSGAASIASQVPAGVRVSSAAFVDGAACALGPVVRCDLTALSSGETRALRIEVVGTTGGLVVHRASIASAIADPDLANNATATITAIDGAPFDPDGDGMSTACEVTYGTLPTEPDGAMDPDGDGRASVDECRDGTHPRGFYTRYFAEGASNRFFRTDLAYLNPDPSMSAHVQTTLLGESGPVASSVTQLAPRTPLLLDAAQMLAGQEGVFSTVIESDLPVVAERGMSWDARGYGSSAQRAIETAATEWYLAEGATGVFSLFYLLQNPSSHETADVTLRYLLPAGAPIERRLVLPPYSRTTVDVGADPESALQAATVSAHITSTRPIVVERAMYRSGRDELFTAGHAGEGATTPATHWWFAEGASGPFFDTFLLLANAGSQAGEARVTYELPGGDTVVKHYAIAPESRLTIPVDGEDARLATATFAMVVESTVPIVAERAMWWPGPLVSDDAWYEGHVSLGETRTASRWALAGGAAGGPGAEQTFVLIANHGAACDVRVTVLFETGDAHERVLSLAATSRRTIDVAAEFPEARDRRFSVLIESLGSEPAPLTVEYARYATPDGRLWSAGMASLATPIP